ncbi:hypothetical protein AWB68_05387 [Caballeronia choica]|uniref:Uncharacterized protein n=1 Tax=Caballeronia choica TaxID=326476 RepID=A0A158KAZ2_9BURK|nr:hypothetical protein AWB68_05387 [Caballeronia choica]
MKRRMSFEALRTRAPFAVAPVDIIGTPRTDVVSVQYLSDIATASRRKERVTVP